MTFTDSMKLALMLGGITALLMGDPRAMIFTVPAAVVLVSAACLAYLMLSVPKR